MPGAAQRAEDRGETWAEGEGCWCLRRDGLRDPRTAAGSRLRVPQQTVARRAGLLRSGRQPGFAFPSSAALKSPACSKAQPKDGLNMFIMALEKLKLFL